VDAEAAQALPEPILDAAPAQAQTLGAPNSNARGTATQDAVGAVGPQADTLAGGVTPQNDYVYGAPGCTDWPSWKGYQRSPWDQYARGNGWSKAGPSWSGQGGHVNCNYANMLNDFHAIDFPLREWDSVYAPAGGRVIYAGWASGGWAGAGRVVIVDLGNGYWSGAYHLRSITVSTGQYINASTRIGYAGGSGHGRDGYFLPHLHQGLYLNAVFSPAGGGVYGGQSVEPHYIRTRDGGLYTDIAPYQWLRY
jgi:murein DD-endopeptidase MepM/ murein hydrolase activator NlpD